MLIAVNVNIYQQIITITWLGIFKVGTELTCIKRGLKCSKKGE